MTDAILILNHTFKFKGIFKLIDVTLMQNNEGGESNLVITDNKSQLILLPETDEEKNDWIEAIATAKAALEALIDDHAFEEDFGEVY